MTLPASPAKGTYTYKDDQDYYTVHLEKGERLALRVSGATGPYSDSEIECTLYDAGSWSAWDRPVAEAWWVNWMSYGVADSELFGMDGFSYVAPETGDYYLNVWGSGEVYDPRTDRSLPAPYRLDWEIVTPGADDDVPGIELTSAETSGTLDYPFDETDVYRVHASEGQRLNVTVETKDKLDIDLGIFGPGSTSVYRDYWVAGSATGNAHESVSFTVPEDGDYYIHAVAWAGSGTYTLRWSVLDSGDFAVAASVDTTKPAYGKPSVFNATVTDPGDGNAPVADQAVHLQRFVNEPEWGEFGWSTVDVGSTDASGNAVLNGRSSEAATWRVVTMDGWDIDTVTARYRHQAPRADHSAKPFDSHDAYGPLVPVARDDAPGSRLEWARRQAALLQAGPGQVDAAQGGRRAQLQPLRRPRFGPRGCVRLQRQAHHAVHVVSRLLQVPEQGQVACRCVPRRGCRAPQDLRELVLRERPLGTAFRARSRAGAVRRPPFRSSGVQEEQTGR